MDFLPFNNRMIQPPIDTNSVLNFDPKIVAQDAKGTRIIVHSRFPKLVDDFLKHKRAHGSEYEKAFYSDPENCEWKQEISRLIERRPLVFMSSTDHTMLPDGTKASMKQEWDRNGTDKQHLNKYLKLADYLSYDEIMLGSLIGVSSSSYFINDGNRANKGKPGKAGTFQQRGVIIGLVGARFEREDRMDSTHILPSATDPHQDPQLSKIFQQFFGVKKKNNTKFDKTMYQARMRVTVDILLLEANARAKEAGKTAYTYVVGLGLGVWQVVPDQEVYYIETFVSALKELDLPNISTLEFAWIQVPQSCQENVRKAAAKKDINVIFSNKRNPAEKLKTKELLVLSYAWDGNAFPGNEYWEGALSASGDPAAACMSTIGELHNPLVNSYTDRIEVLGS